MLFNSWVFLAFFVTVLAGWYLTGRTKAGLLWLVAASYVFYGWLNPLYVVLIVYTTVVNYAAGIGLGRISGRKAWLAVAIASNVLMLGFFKYAGFAVENVNALLAVVADGVAVPAPGTLLPVGLSFYTFMATGYVIDCYRGTIDPERNIVRFAAFISFFPYLLAGPIERASNMLPKLAAPSTFKIGNVTDGLSMFVVGLFKKIALADFLAIYVNRVYDAPGDFGGFALLMATYAFAWQIYFDFSGYTDMARGCAKMLGFDLMLNFNNPYLSASLGEFWQRWHISLSSWFKDYLYIPLGGNRKGRLATYRNMIMTMLVAGLWHGAAWNFVIWGALHALGRTVTRELEATRFYAEHIPRFVKQILIFHFVCVTWIFFRADTFGGAMDVLGGIFTASWSDPRFPVAGIVFMLGIWAYQFVYESRIRRILEPSAVRVALMTAMILYMIFFRTSGYEVFLYFRF